MLRTFRHVSLLLALLLLASAGTALAQDHGAGYRPAELILKFRSTTTPDQQTALLREVGATEVKDLTFIGAKHAHISGSVEEALSLLSGDPRLEYVEPNYIYRTQEIPNDPNFPQLWGMLNTGQTGGTPGADISATTAWDIFTGSSDVLVGVIDTGIDYTHPDLAAQIWTNPGEIPFNGLDDDGNGYIDDVRGWDFVNNDNDPYDDHSHGTHVSGTIGGIGNNGIGVAGVSWQVRLMALKFLDAGGYGSTEGAIAAIQYATMMGCKITSNSWGGGGYSLALLQAIQQAYAAGSLFVAAAGNNWGSNNDIYPNYPSNYDVPNVVAVAATDHNDLLAGFSNIGPTTVDLGAPGDNILSSVPGGYGYMSGTSMATPHVSGALALILGRFPGISADASKGLLLAGVDPLPSLAGMVLTGGRLNAFNPIAEPDSLPPAAVSDLAVTGMGGSSADLRWTATGDDGSTGTASAYDMRYSTAPIDETNWATAAQAANEPDPSAPGGQDSMTVDGLDFATTYYFAVRVLDEFANASPISNVPSGTTLGPPDIGVLPSAVSRDLYTGETATAQMHIENTGVSDLEFDIDVQNLTAASAAVVGATVTPSDAGVLARGRSVPVADLLWRAPQVPARVGLAAAASPIDRDAPSTRGLGTLESRPRRSGGSIAVARTAGDQVLAPVEEVFGNMDYGFTAGPRSRGNIFACTQSTQLLEHRLYLGLTTATQLWFLVYEGMAQSGTYNLVSAADVSPAGPGTGWYSSGDLDVPLEAGRYYLIVASFQATSTYYNQQNIAPYPIPASFGQLIAGAGWTWAPTSNFPPDPIQSVPPDAFIDPVAYYQTIVTGTGSRWLGVDPAAGTVPVGQVFDVTLTLDATGLIGGDYDANLLVNSNDPDEPQVAVPVHLHVTGAPDIAVAPGALDYGDVFIGATPLDSVEVSNVGTDVLHVSGATVSGTDFSGGLPPFDVAVGESRWVVVQFAPTMPPGPRSGELRIECDDPDEPVILVPLQGVGNIPPDIAWAPDSLHADLFTGETATRTLTLSNVQPGGADLLYEVRTFPVTLQAASEPRREAGRRPGAGTTGERHDGKALAVPVGPASTRPLLERLLANLPPSAVVFYDDVEHGLNGWTTQVWGPDDLWHQTQLASNSPTHSWWCGLESTGNYDTGNRINTAAVSPPIDLRGFLAPATLVFFENYQTEPGWDFCMVEVTADGGATWLPLRSPPSGTSGGWVMTSLDLSPYVGSVIQLRFHFDTGDSVANSFPGWFYDDIFVLAAGVPWLTVTPSSGAVPAGASQDLEVLFDAAGQLGGDYAAEIRIGSNDPDEPTVVVPATMHVTGAPDIVVGSTSLDFGNVYIGTGRQLLLHVENGGTDVLYVYDVGSDNARFAPDTTSFALAVGESRDLVVTFTPTATGLETGTLALQSNDPDEPQVDVALRGEGLEPPIIGVAPDSLHADLLTGGTDDQTVTVSNTGGSDLQWQASIDYGALSAVLAADPARAGSGSRPDAKHVATTPPPAPAREDIATAAAPKGRALAPAGGGRGSTPSTQTLENLLAALNVNYASVNGIIPNRFDFTEGETGNSIADGGNDMYDGGNYVNTPYCAGINYSNNLVSDNPCFGPGGRYFTRKYEGLFVMVADMQNVPEFFINGNLGADGSGSVDAATLATTAYGRTYLGFVKRVYNAGDPSVNHLIIVDESPGIQHAYSTNTDDDYDDVYDLPASTRVYYLLYAGTGGAYIDNDATLAIMNAFLGALDLVPPWLSVTPDSGTVPAGGSQDVTVRFDAAGLLGGDYAATVRFGSNDPITPLPTVRATMHVTGAPDIAVSPSSLDYGVVCVGAAPELPVVVRNVGTDVLHVTNVASDNARFTPNASSFDVGIGDSVVVAVAFAPNAAGAEAGTLTIDSNDGDEPQVLVALQGTGLLPPVMTVAPDSLHADLFTGETADRILTVGNVLGGSDLHFQVQLHPVVAQAASTAALPVKAARRADAPAGVRRDGTDLAAPVGQASTRPMFDRYLANLPSSAVAFQDDMEHGLNGWTTVVFMPDDLWHQTELAYNSPTHSWWCGLESTGDYNTGNTINTAAVSPPIDLRFFEPPASLVFVETYQTEPGWDFCMVEATADGGATWQHLRTPPSGTSGGWVMTSLDLSPYVGSVIQLRFHFDTGDSVANSYPGWFFDDVVVAAEGVPWLTVTPTSGTVPPGSSQGLNVHFDAAGLVGGDYAAEIEISSADCGGQQAVVPATLHVTGAPDIAVSDSTLDFGDVYVGGTRQLTLVVRNVGTDVLHVTNMSIDNGRFQLPPGSPAFDLAVGASRDVVVTFVPVDPVAELGTLTITSDDPDTPQVQVDLLGTGQVPPDITWHPGSLQATVVPGERDTLELVLGNVGGSPLGFAIQTTAVATGKVAASDPSAALAPWLWAVPGAGIVPPNDSLVVRMVFDAGALVPGVYLSDIIIQSNDPDENPVIVPARLDVVGRPKLVLVPDEVHFGTVYIGFPRDATVLARNIGTEPLIVSGVTPGLPDYTVLPANFNLAPGQSQPLNVRIAATATGDRSTTIAFATNEPDSPRLLPVSATALTPPVAVLEPPSVQATLLQGQKALRKLSLRNVGTSPLDYAVRAASIGAPVPNHAALALDKGADDPRPGILGTGGPDAFGYTWIDSDEPGGPQFQWIDISSTGMPIPFSSYSDEENVGPLPIGFIFPFYGNIFWSLRVCTNGWVSFTNAWSYYTNQPLPSSGPGVPENLLACLWDDLVFDGTVSSAYYKAEPTRCVLQFNNMKRWGDWIGPGFSFEIVLYPDGQIVYQYLDLGTTRNSCTVGIQNAPRDDGLTVVFNQDYLHETMAVALNPPRPAWLDIQPNRGTVQPGGVAVINLNLDSGQTTVGDHVAQVLVGSNDPASPTLSSFAALRVLEPFGATVALEPALLDLAERAGDVTAFLEFAPPLDPSQVDPASVRLIGLAGDPARAVVGDHDQNGTPDLAVPFPRRDVLAALPAGSPVELLVVGSFANGANFNGTGRVEVRRHQVLVPNGGEILHVGDDVVVRWTVPTGWPATGATLSFSDDDGSTWTPIASHVSGDRHTWRVPHRLTSQGRMRIELFDSEGSLGADASDAAFAIQVGTTDTEEDRLPQRTALLQNVPNPFNPTTTIRYDLAVHGRVRLSIYDTEGRLVRVLVDRDVAAGRHEAIWDGTDGGGRRVSSGVYFYRLQAADVVETKRMVILK